MQRTSRNPEPEYVTEVSVFAAAEDASAFLILRAKNAASASTFRDVTAADDRGASAAAARAGSTDRCGGAELRFLAAFVRAWWGAPGVPGAATTAAQFKNKNWNTETVVSRSRTYVAQD